MKRRCIVWLLVMAMLVCNIPMTGIAATAYEITVMGGTATNSLGQVITQATPGTVVTITADEAPEGCVFDMWMFMGEGAEEVGDVYASTTTFVMPENAVTVMSGYTQVPVLYEITVMGGTATNSLGQVITQATPGTVVTITADEAPEGCVFDMWMFMGEGAEEVGDVYASTTTFVMPENAVTVMSGYTQEPVPYEITVMGGIATNSSGQVITQAIPGTVVTITADEAPEGFMFDMWMFMGEGAEEVGDVYASTTTFVMPYNDVIVMSGYCEKVDEPVEQVRLSLLGYHIGADASCLQVQVSEGVELVDNIDGLHYTLVLDQNGQPGNQVVSGSVKSNTGYWLLVLLDAKDGYTLENLSLSNVYFTGPQALYLTTNTEGQKLIMAKLPYAQRSLLQRDVSVTGGMAYNNLTPVTKASQGMTIRLVAGDAPEGMYFSHWQVNLGNVILADPYSSTTTFTVGSADVSVEAVFATPIVAVFADIAEPHVGMTPSYEAYVNAGDAYGVDAVNAQYFKNGVAWRNLDTEEYLDPETDVFAAEGNYEVQILLAAEPGKQFALTNGYPAVEGSVNLRQGYVEQYAEDSSRYVVLTASFSLPAKEQAHTYVDGVCAVCGKPGVLVLTEDTVVNYSLNRDLYVDLNGHYLSGTIIANGYKVYGKDSATDDYTSHSAGNFSCIDEWGNQVIPETHYKDEDARRYLTVQTNAGYSFRRFYMGITHVSLKTEATGLGYKALFCGDDSVKAMLDPEKAFAITLQLEDGQPVTRYMGQDGLTSGDYISLRLHDYDVENYGETTLKAWVAVTLSDGTVIESTPVSTTMRDVLQTLDGMYDALTPQQLTAVRQMLAEFEVVKDWNLWNLLG